MHYQFAAYSAAAFMRKQDLMASHGVRLEGAVSWAFTFHDQPWFNGLRAFTTNEVDLPVLNAFRLFSQLRGERVRVDNPGMIPTGEIIADSVRGRSDVGAVATTSGQLLVWNFHDVAGDTQRAEVRVVLRGAAKPNQATAMRVLAISARGLSRVAGVAAAMPSDSSPSL